MSEVPPAVRILPMNREKEFPQYRNIEELQQQFFLGELPKRKSCEYLAYTGLRAEPGTVILFQSDGSIIASAILSEFERFPHPDSNGYTGQMLLHSIVVFEPISKDTIKAIWPTVQGLGRVKWNVAPEGYPTFERIISKVRTPE